MSDNVLDMGKDKKFPREGELMEKLSELIDTFEGDLSMVAVLGVLELKKQEIVYTAVHGDFL